MTLHTLTTTPAYRPHRTSRPRILLLPALTILCIVLIALPQTAHAACMSAPPQCVPRLESCWISCTWNETLLYPSTPTTVVTAEIPWVMDSTTLRLDHLGLKSVPDTILQGNPWTFVAFDDNDIRTLPATLLRSAPLLENFNVSLFLFFFELQD
jgi:hypothetical protein